MSLTADGCNAPNPLAPCVLSSLALLAEPGALVVPGSDLTGGEVRSVVVCRTHLAFQGVAPTMARQPSVATSRDFGEDPGRLVEILFSRC